MNLVFISITHFIRQTKNYLKESYLTHPLNVYAITKKKSEEIIINNLRNFLIIRTNFFGWGPKYRKSFSDIIIENLEKNKKIELFNDVYFNPVNVRYLCIVINKLIQKNSTGIFNVTSNKAISKYRFGILLCKEFNFDKKLIKSIKLVDKKITKRPNFMSLSNKKLIRTLKISTNELSIIKQINKLKLKKENLNKL